MAQVEYDLGAVNEAIAKIELWSGKADTIGSTYTLNGNISDYKFILIEYGFKNAPSTYNTSNSMILTSETVKDNTGIVCYGYANRYTKYSFTNNTFTLQAFNSNEDDYGYVITKIVGIN